MNKMKTRKRKLYGGDAIEGMQGCVVIPSLLVDAKMKTRNTSYVTKIFFKDADYEEEKRQNDTVISTLDPRGTFTSATYTTTPVDLRYLTPKELGACTQLKGMDITKLKFLNYRYMGKSLHDIVSTDMKINGDVSLSIISSVANLGVKILHMNNDLKLFHNDVHEGNIMYSFKDEHAYLIDFGSLSKTPNNNNQLTDLQGLVTALRLFATSVVNQGKISKPRIDQLNSFIKDSSLTLIRTSEIKDPVEARNLIVKFLTDFSLSYMKTGGRHKKTLRRVRHKIY